MKKLLIIVLIMCLCLTTFVGCSNNKDEADEPGTQTQVPANPAETHPATDVSSLTDAEIFNFDSATNTINGFNESIFGVTDIVIPAKIDGADVFVIASNAFTGLSLNSVIFPDSLVTIESNAFTSNNITQIEFPEGIKTIGTAAFERNKITEVTIPSSITRISVGLFSGNLLTKINLPDTITSIGRNAFATNKLTAIVIPPNVKSIESFAFADNLIETVEFNDGLESIDGRAFSINKLTSIIIPASVKSIGAATEGATPATNYERFPFSYNPQIKSVTMLGSNTTIEPFFLAENNNFRMSYDKDGAGTYTGSQYGQWKKAE